MPDEGESRLNSYESLLAGNELRAKNQAIDSRWKPRSRVLFVCGADFADTLVTREGSSLKVTLTFDNGPDEIVTPHVLEVLARHDISATFFVLGHKLQDPELRAVAEQAKTDGHWIGNHTWSHETPLGDLDDAERSVSEIRDTEALMNDLSHEQRFFRPFGNGGQLDERLLSEASRRYLEDEGFTVVLWNSVPGDWQDPIGWVETALDQISAQEWSVVVLHDMPADGAMDRLEDFIVEAKARGAEFVQEMPATMTPMQRGVSKPELASFVRTAD